MRLSARCHITASMSLNASKLSMHSESTATALVAAAAVMASVGLHKEGQAARTHIALAPAAAALVPALTGGALPASAGLLVAAAAARESSEHQASEHQDLPAVAGFGFIAFMHRKA